MHAKKCQTGFSKSSPSSQMSSQSGLRLFWRSQAVETVLECLRKMVIYKKTHDVR